MNNEVSFLAIIIAAVVQFIVGAIWYMPVFGSHWARIHDFEKHDKKTQQEMQKGMVPLLLAQFLSGLVTTYVLAYIISIFSRQDAYIIALWMWFGFVVPTQVAAVLFGGTKPKWVFIKIAIMAGGSLVCMMATALVFNLFN